MPLKFAGDDEINKIRCTDFYYRYRYRYLLLFGRYKRIYYIGIGRDIIYFRNTTYARRSILRTERNCRCT